MSEWVSESGDKLCYFSSSRRKILMEFSGKLLLVAHESILMEFSGKLFRVPHEGISSTSKSAPDWVTY